MCVFSLFLLNLREVVKKKIRNKKHKKKKLNPGKRTHTQTRQAVSTEN